MFDFGLAKQYIDPVTGEHMPYRDGLVGLGMARFASHNMHFGRGESCLHPERLAFLAAKID